MRGGPKHRITHTHTHTHTHTEWSCCSLRRLKAVKERNPFFRPSATGWNNATLTNMAQDKTQRNNRANEPSSVTTHPRHKERQHKKECTTGKRRKCREARETHNTNSTKSNKPVCQSTAHRANKTKGGGTNSIETKGKVKGKKEKEKKTKQPQRRIPITPFSLGHSSARISFRSRSIQTGS